MVTLNNVSFEFGGRFLYQNASLDIQPSDRIGLIGRNGTGKSTLLRIIAGEYKPTEGSIVRSNNLKLGFLNQDLLGFESHQTIFEVALSAFEQQLKLQAEINDLLHKLETDTSEKLLHELGDKQHDFEQNGGYEMESQTRTLLAGLGFSQEDQDKPFSTFSGGWRMRGILAKLLLGKPDLLLLDEPTNHLDLPSIQWLESYLQKSPAAYIIVSHDRFFLNRMIQKTVEVAHGKLHLYAGDYNYYLKEKEQRREIQQASYENQQKMIADAERFIERFKAKASKATQAQSRIKMLEKLDRVDAPEDDEATVSFSFQPATRAGVEILSLNHVSKTYTGGKTILNDAQATIRRGDKIGLIGANGVGKSTALRILAGAEDFTGERKLGYNVQAGFFAQHQLEALNLENTILDECSYYVMEKGETYVRSVLGGFLFTGDDVHKKIKVLSGGERSRVALAKTLLSESNFLLLDEPTNHLDMQSIQILAQALQQYTGTYILVSHDRFFLGLTTNKIWYLENREIKEYPGSYAEFDAWQKAREAESNANGKPDKAEARKAAAAPQTDEEKKRLRRNQTELKKTEESIQELEARLGELEGQLCDPAIATNYSRIASLEKEVIEVKREMETRVRSWENLLKEIEAMA
jgi:ATP-binding cassette subfamily F protein 3